MDLVTVAISFLIVFVAGFIQGLVGFGSGLFSVPLLAFIFGPRFVVPLTLVHGLLMNMYLSVKNKKRIQWRRVLPILVTGVVGIPFGTLILIFLPSEWLKVMIGIVISIFAVLLLVGYSKKVRNEKLALLPVGFTSGLLNGSISMSGPPVILFMTNQAVRKEIFRANIVTYFFLLNIVTLLIFIFTGILTEEVLITSMILLPPLPAGIIAGEFMSRKVSEELFRKIALFLVLGTGIIALITGILSII
jgi:hypothetical protein